ncbi:hypothetical protein [Pseudomonas sp. RIT-PI-r]|uniref:hypothetical protein n=1 Tax=Pseudomonas sp. RIT-PI-r TaxID=1699620 RepID=UPI00128FAA9E|nr:hypothetical protein [Pseudomonas sp. RIT-PI-r]
MGEWPRVLFEDSFNILIVIEKIFLLVAGFFGQAKRHRPGKKIIPNGCHRMTACVRGWLFGKMKVACSL